MANDVVVSEFKLQLFFYVHFRTNTPGTSLFLQTPTEVLFNQDGFGIKWPMLFSISLSKETKKKKQKKMW